MVNFFIDRPVFAWVIAILIMLAGGLAIKELPIAQYPSIAPPSIAISGTYPGASSETVQSTVVQVIEQQLSGIDNLLYFTSESDKDGSLSINLYFNQGTNADIAQVQVQNKLQLATPSLPLEVQQQGLRVAKSTRNFLLVAGFYSRDKTQTTADISDFIASVVQDPVSRTPGVGDFLLFGSQYAMRIWVDPAKLRNFSLTPADLKTAIQAQNVQIPSGELGGLPIVKGQQLNATIVGPSRLKTPAEFGAILVKTAADGSQIRLRDVARIELDAESFTRTTQFNGYPSAALAVKLAAGSNALETADAVRTAIAKLKPLFPSGYEVVYPYDTTPFVKLSIHEVVKTLIEAIFLVFCVMLLFLQNFRATLIPTIAVPVVLLGTFAVLSAAGFSINVLTLFAMVLAIGLLVDDAIVVVENVERVMSEEGLDPKAAVKKSMTQITGALVGIALVLTAVFIPMAFFGGSTGVVYRQFSITMASAMVLSVLIALIFTPVLCATLLSPVEKGHKEKDKGFFGYFNKGFNWTRNSYGKGVNYTLSRTFRFVIVYAVLIGGLIFLFPRIPTSFLPDEDQGVLFVQVTTPPGATLDRTSAILSQIRDYFLTEEKEAVYSVYTVAGFSFGGRGQSSGLGFIKLNPWEDRPGAKNRVQAIAARASKHFAQYKDAMAFAFAPPAALELGNATGFDLQLLDLGGAGHEALMNARNQFLGMASKSPLLVGVRPNGLNDEPQYKIQIDRDRATALGLSLADVHDTLTEGWGSAYVNDFVDRGRIKRVFIQGEATSRMQPQDFENWFVRNQSGSMVPFSAFATGSWGIGSPKLERYNGTSSVEILGMPVPGKSSGDAMTEVQNLVAKLPPGIGYDWTGLSFEEKRAGSQTIVLYSISLLVVFLCLAALYESWAVPFAVMLTVPLGVLGAVMATYFRGLANDVFFQVGLLTTIGLSAKNAILIIEFAKEGYDQGTPLLEATLHAAQQRLRPILMTSLAFILGVLPLAIASGAGSGGQNAIGTGVVGGMLTATILAIFFIPLFFVGILRLFKVKPTKGEPHPDDHPDHQPAPAEQGHGHDHGKGHQSDPSTGEAK
ncbi:multidrug efflux pump [Verrucomicrobium sp. GAS474]|uniref:efflux RND transporter permease subunit n=1 Tax=Verrucomicrobium sp. GAS474 TaxID=1882831 RepID=UPI00087DCE76|nr:efflux RND transporter permease subunit [Verrucomicrobium sp. GAS474]SDU00953.1 multidrug efflux pump [Verrucomicrobium sp. GAS474]